MWQYIVELEKLQSEEGVTIANKITKKHIHYGNQKMKVKLAAQTFSNSVADALEYVKDKYPQFKGCEATIKYIKMVNDAYDILNSRNLIARGYKRGLCSSNANDVMKKLDEVSKYISNLTVNQDGTTKVVDTEYRTGFVGFLVAIKSFRGLYDDYIVNSDRLRFLLAYKFSQDNIETLFSVIRSKGGFNDAPNTVQFQATIKRLLVQHEIRASVYANCTDWSDTVWLNVSVTKLNTTSKTNRIQDNQDNQENQDPIDEMDEEQQANFIPLSCMTTDVVIYISGFVERTLKKKIKCPECLIALDTNDIWYGEIINIKNNGKLNIVHREIEITSCTVVFEQTVQNGCFHRTKLLTSPFLWL